MTTTTPHLSRRAYTEIPTPDGPPALLASATTRPVFRLVSYGLRWRTVPEDVQIAIDLRRLLTDPRHLMWLRDQTGLEHDVQNFVLTSTGINDVLNLTADLGELIAQQITPMHRTVSVGIGGEWGRQRSVVVASELDRRWTAAGVPTELVHLDIQRPLPA